MDVVAAVGEFVATIGDGESRQAAVWAIRSSCGRLVGVNRRWLKRPTSSRSEFSTMRVPSRICIGSDSSRSCRLLISRSHWGFDAHHSAPSRSIAVASGDSAVRARYTRSGRDRRVQASAARPRSPVNTAVMALMLPAWSS